jgi:DNA-binding GntR family transcriptional regulator
MKQEDTVYQYIEKAILENRMPPGTRLRELQLGEIFGVKRGLIRKVLSRLTAAKLVDHIPNVGAQVACPSLKDGQDLFATRQILEQGVIQQLCGKLTTEQFQSLREYTRRERLAYQIGDTQKGVRLSAGFHRRLAELTGNQVILEFLQDILNRTPLVMMSLPESQPIRGCINHDHENLLQALESGECLHAVDIMREHLQQLENMFSTSAPQSSPDLAEIFQRS